MRLLSSKIFAGYLLIIVILTGLILFFTYRNVSNQYVKSITDNLFKINSTLHFAVLNHFENNNLDRLDNYVKKLGKKIRVRITIVDSLGNVIADSERDPKTMENHRQRPELQPIFEGKLYGTAERYSTTVHKEMIYVAEPIFSSRNQFLGAIRVSIFRHEAKQLINKLNLEILQIALIMIVLSLLGVLVFVRTLTKPINQISLASRKVAQGDFDVKINIKGRDEIYELAQNFNNMTEKLKELFSEVIRQKDELNTIIKAIQDGLVAFDTTGKVLVANRGFCNVISNDDILDKNIYEITDIESLRDIFKEVLSSGSSFTKEICIDKRHFICSANFIQTKKEIVLLFHDITEFKKLEQLKKDFVVNVSHELRTPLTAIKGFIETLEDELQGSFNHYIDIIKRHTNRLINIVQDLLLLSELEQPNTKLIKTSVDLNIIIDNVLKIFEQKLKEKNLQIQVSYKSHYPKLVVDIFKMEQVFINLIDNAIKYSDSGTIEINCSYDENYAYISVKDNGIGISKEDQERVFERFYIVDKSRSKKFGGTGLGLSIVKHIILLHNGEITVESEKGKGTTFKIKLPLSDGRPTEQAQ
jgi:two-component system phosphate regulon sensor histidine kinase PhoR